MCASVISFGSQGISRLQVWEECMIEPSGNLIAIGWVATLTFTAGEPLIRKCEDAPESDSAYFTRCTSRLVLNIMDELAEC